MTAPIGASGSSYWDWVGPGSLRLRPAQRPHVSFWSSGSPSEGLSLNLLLHTALFSTGRLPAHRVLTVWVYDRTESLLVAMLMYAGLKASTMIVEPAGPSGMRLLDPCPRVGHGVVGHRRRGCRGQPQVAGQRLAKGRIQSSIPPSPTLS